MPALILASGSPRRSELLSHLDLDFTVALPLVDEDSVDELTPAKVAEETARLKAHWVTPTPADQVVIAADTIVVLDGEEVLGKPKHARGAVAMLRRLSGREHQVITGVALWQPSTGREDVFHATTRVFFRRLTIDEIHRYVATGEPLDKAGAYGLQGKGSLLVERIEGCYFNVVGLPLPRLAEALRPFGVTLL